MRSGVKTWKKPHGPSSVAGWPANPRAASWAAMTPDLAALPAWYGLMSVPKFWRSPAADDTATAIALRTCSSGRPSRLALAQAAPMAPSVPVGCHP